MKYGRIIQKPRVKFLKSQMASLLVFRRIVGSVGPMPDSSTRVMGWCMIRSSICSMHGKCGRFLWK